MLITETSNGQGLCYVRNVGSDDFGVAGNCTCTNSNATPCELLPDLSPSFLDTQDNYEFDYPDIKFRTTVANIGEGPLEMKFNGLTFCGEPSANLNDAVSAAYEFAGGGSNDDFVCEGSAGLAYPLVDQIIYRMGGDYIREPAGYTEFTHGNHDHLHWANWAITSLRIGDANNRQNFANWPVVVRGEKTGFALVDFVVVSQAGAYIIKNCTNHLDLCLTENVSGMTTSNRATIANQNFGGMLNAPNCNLASTNDVGFDCFYSQDYHVTEAEVISSSLFGGISAGNFDTYNRDLDGQSLEFGNGCNGTYFLVTEVDPENKIRESDETNNVSVAEISITNSKDPNSGTVISSSTTSSINSDMVLSEITVKQNDTFTISNCTIEFTENARIEVEKGAKLIIDGAILTTVCDQIFWEGIQVHGDSSVPHPATVVENGNYPDHGVVIIKNNSIIENANNAVKTMKVDNYGTDNQGPDHSNRHGIVIIENAEFYNNICGVVLFGGDDITATTASKINNARFTIDDAFHSANFTHNPNPLSGQYNHDPDFQVFLKEVSGVRISLSTFDNQATKISGKLAMRVEESTFALMDSEVKNFDKGIEAIGSSMTDQAKQIFISNNTFSGNDASVHISGYNQDVSDIETYDGETSDFAIHITNENVFDVPLERQDYSAYVAVFLDGCSDYIISNNDFTGGFSNSILLSSVRIENSDDNTTNYIQNNDFLSQQTADIFAHFTNPSAQILCNTFFGNSATGIFTMGNTGATDDVIDPIQGSCLPIEDRISDQPETYPTGNILSTAHTQFASSFHGNFQYNYYPGERPSGNLPGNIMIPNNSCSFGTKTCDFTNEVVETDENDPHSENVCCDCARVGKNLDKALELNKYIEQDKALLTKYNRKEESAFIEAATDISKIKSIIEQYDVYLSNNELKAVAQKLGSLPPVDILNILIDNAPLETEVKSVIQDHLSALPVFTANFLKRQYSKQFQQLLDQTNGLSLRLEKEFEVKRNTRAQKILWQGPILVGPDIGGGGIPCRSGSDIKQYIAEALVTLSKNTVENKKWFSKKAIEYCIETGQNQYAKNILSDFKSDVNNVNYILLEELKIRLKEEKRNLNELRPDEISLLKEIEGDLNIEGILARNALAIYNESSLPIDIPKIPDENLKKSTATINTIGNDISNMLDLWPNPSSEVVNINLGDIYDTAAIIKINIFDHAGKFIKKIDLPYQKILKLSIMDLEEGAYIINVTDENNNKQGRAKLLIIR